LRSAHRYKLSSFPSFVPFGKKEGTEVSGSVFFFFVFLEKERAQKKAGKTKSPVPSPVRASLPRLRRFFFPFPPEEKKEKKIEKEKKSVPYPGELGPLFRSGRRKKVKKRRKKKRKREEKEKGKKKKKKRNKPT